MQKCIAKKKDTTAREKKNKNKETNVFSDFKQNFW